MSKLYTFRETTDKKELEACFRLRYKMYSATSNKVFITENSNEMDVDSFDVHARHYLLMHNATIAAYIRVILPQQQLTNRPVIDIGQKYSLLNRKETSSEKNAHAPFPFLSYKGVPESHWDYYKDLRTKYSQIAEASRLIVNPEYGSLSAVRYLVECAIVCYMPCIMQNQTIVIINCGAKHKFFYKHYGFKEISDAGEFCTNGLDKVSLSITSISKQYLLKFESMAEEFSRTGIITRQA